MIQDEAIQQSRFYLVRCLIAIAHEDSLMHPMEIAYLKALINHLDFDEDQLAILYEDFTVPRDIGLLAPKILHYKKKMQLFFFGRILAIKDGNFHVKETKLLKKLDHYFKDEVDINLVHKLTNDFLEKHDYLESANSEGVIEDGRLVTWFELFDKLLLDAGYDLLR